MNPYIPRLFPSGWVMAGLEVGRLTLVFVVTWVLVAPGLSIGLLVAVFTVSLTAACPVWVGEARVVGVKVVDG
jgi:hypothetical protein